MFLLCLLILYVEFLNFLHKSDSSITKNTCRTQKFDAYLKVALGFALPALFAIWVGLSIAGSVLVGVGYGFFTPWVSSFEAFRHDHESAYIMFFHCIVVIHIFFCLFDSILNQPHCVIFIFCVCVFVITRMELWGLLKEVVPWFEILLTCVFIHTLST